MAPNDPLRDLRVRAYRAAEGLGHPRISSEHLLLALVATESASGQALRACGLSRESVLDEISRLPGGYYEKKWPHDTLPTTKSNAAKQLDPEVQEIYVRAQGLAAGLDISYDRPEEVLLSLLWHRSSILALRFIEKHGVTREQVVAELRRRGIKVPEVPLPKHPKWGPPFYVSREEFERLTADLRRRGVLYKFNYKEGDRVIISIDERGEGP